MRAPVFARIYLAKQRNAFFLDRDDAFDKMRLETSARISRELCVYKNMTLHDKHTVADNKKPFQ